MTVSANYVPDYQRDQILTAAIRQVGILEQDDSPSQAQIAAAAVHLNMILEELQSSGYVLSTVERTSLSLISGTLEYTLPTTILDIAVGQDDTIGTILTSAGVAQTLVKTMSAEEYQALAVKDIVTGTPSRCYVEKLQAAIKLLFWPVPDTTGATFNYRMVRFLKASDTGATTTDLKRPWTKYLMHAVSAAFARDSSLYDRASTLDALAERSLQRCISGDVQHGSIQLRVAPSGRNW